MNPNRLKFVNFRNLQELVPPWAIDHSAFAETLDYFFKNYPAEKRSFDKRPDFWIEVNPSGLARLVEHDKNTLDDPAYAGHPGHVIISQVPCLTGGKADLQFPINPLFKEYPSIAGGHSLYVHWLNADVALPYVGITKQRWYGRLAQHVSSARRNSSLVFHKAIRAHSGKGMLHKLIMPGLTYEQAMNYEEDWVRDTLYPVGLNMIPGGFAGLKYLSTLGVSANSALARDKAVEELSRHVSVAGHPNPLCAARWEGDQDFVNRVVCGHSGRLTVDQVRMIRIMAGSGYAPAEIAKSMSVENERQVSDVVRGRYYGRVE